MVEMTEERFIQAEMLFRSLKVLDRPVEFVVVHPGATMKLQETEITANVWIMLRTEFFSNVI
jgi:hypothetical protein